MQMEALCLSSPPNQPHQPKLKIKQLQLPNNKYGGTGTGTFKNPNKIKPFTSHALSKTVAQISVEPAIVVSSREDEPSRTQQPPQLLRASPGSLQYDPGMVGAVPDHLVTEGPLNAMEYLTSIFSSKVYDVAFETPLELVSKLSQRVGVKFWLKREDLQPVFSFKLRGAYNMMAKLPKERLEQGVICSFVGNHAQRRCTGLQCCDCYACYYTRN